LTVSGRSGAHARSRKKRAYANSLRPQKFNLEADCEPQKFGIGIKEVWQIDPAKFDAGRVQHSFDWPLTGTGATGGGFLYHYDENLVSVGFVVHLNYTNPTSSPFDEFQRYKTHHVIRETLEGGKRVAYGARVISSVNRRPILTPDRRPRLTPDGEVR
jgi:electron-transferring-flavoprotein dehydrogenase